MLYSIIDHIGKQKIRSDLTSDIELSRYYIEMIIDKCKERIEAADEETLGRFVKACCILCRRSALYLLRETFKSIIPFWI